MKRKRKTFDQMLGFFVELQDEERIDDDTDENEHEVLICNKKIVSIFLVQVLSRR